MADASIIVGCDASAVERAAQVAIDSWRSASGGITSALSGVARSLADVALQAGRVNFSSQHEQVKSFEATTARMAVSMGRDLESVRSALESTGKSIGKRPEEVALWSQEVGKLTYNVGGAEKAIKGMAEIAATTGRGVDEYKQFAVVLANAGKVAGDTTKEVGILKAQAEAMGVKGGIAAFADEITALGDTIQGFADKGTGGFNRVTATIAALGTGLNAAQGAKAAGSVMGAFQSDPLRWSRYLGKKIYDEHGHVKDPLSSIKEVTEKIKKQHGSQAQEVLMMNFGAEAGSQMLLGDYKAAAKAGALQGTDGTKLAQLNATDAGQRSIAESQLAESARTLMGSSTALGRAADALQKFASKNPISSTIAATAGGSVAASIAGKVAGMAAGAMPGVGGGIASGLGGGLGSSAMIAAAIPAAVAAAALGAGLYGIDKFESASIERHGLENKERESGADSALKLKVLAHRKTNLALRGVSGLSGEDMAAGRKAANDALMHGDAYQALAISKGGEQAITALVDELRHGGKDEKQARIIAEAVAKAMQNVVIQNKGDGPIEVTTKSSNGPASGNQGNGN